jgi:hypothetical protein
VLLADVAAARPEVRHVGALVVGRDLEPDPRPGGVLLEDQGDRPPGEAADLSVLLFLELEAGGKIEQRLDLGCAEVAQRQERPTEEVDIEVDGHAGAPLVHSAMPSTRARRAGARVGVERARAQGRCHRRRPPSRIDRRVLAGRGR